MQRVAVVIFIAGNYTYRIEFEILKFFRQNPEDYGISRFIIFHV